ncbi:MAG: EFR1 family ferrodoxin [Bacilli bacterium]|nr:EFR1 family ferrodoxin [Bacilli bacterium]
MKYLGIYFTGTGNSKRVLGTAKAILLSYGHTLDEVDTSKDDVKDLNEYDGLVISYPIYAFNAPKPIISYVKKISKVNKEMPCLIIKQSGEHLFWNNASSLYLTRLLMKRNIIVKNEYHYLMPYSFIFRHSDYMAYRMDEIMHGLLPLDIKDFLDNKEVHLRRYFLDRFFSWVFRIQWWGGRFNGRFYSADKKKCVKCMKCINECPSHNITLENNKIKFHGQCLMCQRCVMYCPKHAIKAGMFNSWRVDVPYTFKKAEYQKEKKPRFCKKNYERYFKESYKRIEEACELTR